MLNDAEKQEIGQIAMQWLVKLDSPELTEAEEQAFLTWLNQSPYHQAAYIKAEEIWQRGDVLAQLSPNAGSTLEDNDLNPHPQPERSNVVKANFGRVKTLSYLAAAACICMVMVFGVKFYTSPSPYSAQYVTEVGQQQRVELDDGSLIVLNTDTEVSIKYLAKNRIVKLIRGEAFFEVSKDKNRPFDVLTQSGRVRVLGTQFSVTNDQNATTVTVLEGSVGLDSTQRADTGFDSAPELPAEQFNADVTLTANQQLSMQEAAEKAQPRKIDAKNALGWREQNLVFRGERLETVIKNINRYFTQQIRLSDPALAGMEVIAVVQVKDFETALLTLEQSLNLRSERNDETNEVFLVEIKESATPQ